MNCIGNLKSVILCRTKSFDRKADVILLMPITEDITNYIDENDCFNLIGYGHDLIIKSDKILFYGKININDEEDIKIIQRKNIINITHSWIPINLNIETGEGDTKSLYPTYDPVKWFKYCYCRIGKPEHVIAFTINPKLINSI